MRLRRLEKKIAQYAAMLLIAAYCAVCFVAADVALGQVTGPLQKPRIVNVTLGTEDTEVSYTIPPNTRGIRICGRGIAVKYSWTATTSGTIYKTVPAGLCACSSDMVLLSSTGRTDVVYMQSEDVGVVEIEVWQ